MISLTEILKGFQVDNCEHGNSQKDCLQCAREMKEQAEQRLRERMMESRAEDLREACGLSKRFLNYKFTDFKTETAEQARALEIAQRFVGNRKESLKKGRGLLMYGGVGTGKTMLASIVVSELVGIGISSQFTTATQAIRAIKETYSRATAKTEGQAYAELSRPALLVLDEVGAQVGTETERNILLEIINDRYNEIKSLIITSNLDLQGLEELLGARAFDRLREMCVFMPMKWESMRGRG